MAVVVVVVAVEVVAVAGSLKTFTLRSNYEIDASKGDLRCDGGAVPICGASLGRGELLAESGVHSVRLFLHRHAVQPGPAALL